MTVEQRELTIEQRQLEDRNKATWRLWVDIADRHALEEIDDVIAPDFVGHDLPPGLPPGPEGLRQFRRAPVQRFPTRGPRSTSSWPTATTWPPGSVLRHAPGAAHGLCSVRRALRTQPDRDRPDA